ncbi:hypothetical protein EIN_252580 [Entamoeba invadens IP1]|uniref:Uncharacterized protein n=1 Tax=Entamoeba invadens IP1 TaxID=370355 RepID=A0A0A1UGP1_ENTIV|nr:hypothetical protein EIN_252580 [Entamoeba invadens IP1]ELP95024.1 hypothetical protein EIN_252580 [Entamoeba invadens IP1]|eukprot:XP_004261795.1 hypothetical protein EIN_252580 [Entamoeba invadens IP1]
METIFQKSRREKFYETYQQLSLIALLSKYCSFEIKPSKFHKVNCTQLPRIISIKVNEEEPVNVRKLALQQCLHFFDIDEKKMSRNTAHKRFDKNFHTFISNFLIDIALENGFSLNTRFAKETHKTFRSERVVCMKRSDGVYLGQQQIEALGKDMLEYISKNTNRIEAIHIEKGSKIVQKVIENVCHLIV